VAAKNTYKIGKRIPVSEYEKSIVILGTSLYPAGDFEKFKRDLQSVFDEVFEHGKHAAKDELRRWLAK